MDDILKAGGMADRKSKWLVDQGYAVIGYIHANKDEYALSDSSVRWLSRDQYLRLMHEQNSKLFDLPVQHAQAALSDEQIMTISEDYIGACGIQPIEFARAILATSHQPAAAPADAEYGLQVEMTHNGAHVRIYSESGEVLLDQFHAVSPAAQQGRELPQDGQAAFEALGSPRGYVRMPPDVSDLDYVDSITQAQWEGYQAALAQRAASVPAQAVQPVAYADPQAFKNFDRVRAGDILSPSRRHEWMWARQDVGLVPLYTTPVPAAGVQGDDEIDHGETVLRVQEALGITTTGWVSPDVVIHYLHKALAAAKERPAK